jgi:hypothetical protein
MERTGLTDTPPPMSVAGAVSAWTTTALDASIRGAPSTADTRALSAIAINVPLGRLAETRIG